MKFHENCSRSITLSNANRTAERTGDSYDHGVVFSKCSLNTKHNEVFQLVIDRIADKWAGSLRIGVTTINPNSGFKCRALTDIINSVSDVKESYWIWSSDRIHQQGRQKVAKFNLNSLVVNDIVGVQVRSNGEMHTYIHGNHLEMVAKDLPSDGDLFVVFDVYGSAKQVTYVPGGGTLKDLCFLKILDLIKDSSDLEYLPLPQTLIHCLKERCSRNSRQRKRKFCPIKESSRDEYPRDSKTGRIEPSSHQFL